MDITRRTWTAAVKLAVVVSLLAVVAVLVVTRFAHLSHVAIVVPVMIVAFVASWIQTDRIRRQSSNDFVVIHSTR